MAHTAITTFNNKQCKHACIAYKNWMKELQLSNGHYLRRAITSSWQMVFVSAGQFILRPLFVNGCDLRFLRKCLLTARLRVSRLALLFTQTWSAHTLPLTFSWRWQSRPTEKAWYGWQRQINAVYLPAGDSTLQPTHAEMWRWLTKEMNVSRKGHTIQNKCLYLISDVLHRLWLFWI